MRLSRVLVPLLYTSGDRFTHDLALPHPAARRTAARARAARLDPDADALQVRAGGAGARAQPCGSRSRLGGLGSPTSSCALDRTRREFDAQIPDHDAARRHDRRRSCWGFAARPSPPADAQKRGGTLTIVRPTDPVSLEPNLETTAPGAWVYFNMLEGLLTLDEKMQVKPSLATSYEVMSPTKVRFKLRPNVKFHDGTPFNAAAVKFTYDRALKGKPPARWASLAGSLDGAEVVDNLTVDIVTKEPYGPILRTLAMYCMGIVSPTAVQKLGRTSAGPRWAPGRSSSWSGRPTPT